MSTGKFIACLLALAAAGCSNSSTSPTSTTTTTATVTTEIDFTGALAVGATYNSPPFTVAAGTATVNLESVTLTPAGPATAIQLGIGLGPTTTDATGKAVCGNTTTSATVAPALAAQLTSAVTAGSYCVSVYDPGTLTVPVTFVVRAVHP